MKLLVLSDLHLHSTPTFGSKVLEKADRLARQEQPDVLLFNGDLVEPDEGLSLGDGLARLVSLPAQMYLWVVGNNDLEMAPGPLRHYAERIADTARPFGVRVLDEAPQRFGHFTFIGNYGGFDCSLWRPKHALLGEIGIGPELLDELEFRDSEGYPHTLEGVRRHLDETNQTDMSVRAFFEFCQQTLHRHRLDQSLRHPENKVIVSTHTAPTPEMVLYGRSPKWDFLNALMGWDDSEQAAPLHTTLNLVAQFCGHTHRTKEVSLGGPVPLLNVSGPDQPFLFEF